MIMPTIVIQTPRGECERYETEGNEALLDLCDAVMAPVSFSCRATHCATCGVQVMQGANLLEPPGPEEQALQQRWGKDGRRFACAIRIKPGPGMIQLRVCE